MYLTEQDKTQEEFPKENMKTLALFKHQNYLFITITEEFMLAVKMSETTDK